MYLVRSKKLYYNYADPPPSSSSSMSPHKDDHVNKKSSSIFIRNKSIDTTVTHSRRPTHLDVDELEGLKKRMRSKSLYVPKSTLKHSTTEYVDDFNYQNKSGSNKHTVKFLVSEEEEGKRQQVAEIQDNLCVQKVDETERDKFNATGVNLNNNKNQNSVNNDINLKSSEMIKIDSQEIATKYKIFKFLNRSNSGQQKKQPKAVTENVTLLSGFNLHEVVDMAVAVTHVDQHIEGPVVPIKVSENVLIDSDINDAKTKKTKDAKNDDKSCLNVNKLFFKPKAKSVKETQNVKNIDPAELEKELIKEGPPLPLVKFDSNGDFFKEPMEFKPNEGDNDSGMGTLEQTHIIKISKTISIDTRKVKKVVKKGFKFAFSQIGLSGLVVGYVILGALLFMKIESEYELENQIKIEKNREEFFNNVRLSAEDLFNEHLKNNFHTKYNEFRNEEMRLKDKEVIKKSTWRIDLDREEFNRLLKKHLTVLLMENEKIEDKEKPNFLVREDVWNYPNALLYSTTVITTIGYGNITPKSNLGKILTIFYAMVGIPLMFMFLTNTGDLLAELFISTYSKCIRFFYRRMFKHKLKMPYSSTKFQENKQEMLNEFELEYDNPNDRHVPIVATLGVVTLYIFAGALLFSLTENWSILDGAYFCFITFTTIGFGDFVPGRNTLASGKNGVTALCAIYLLLGMVIMTMCFKLMQDEVVSKARWIGKRLGIIDQ